MSDRVFLFLGNTVTRGWQLFLGGWVLALALVSWTAPAWNTVAEDREFGFLPPTSPGRRGEAMLNKAFPGQLQGSNVVFVLHRDDGKLTGVDYAFIDKVLKPGLEDIAKKAGGLVDRNPREPPRISPAAPPHQEQQATIKKISTARDPGTGLLLLSADHKATLVVVELTTEFMELRNRTTLGEFEDFLEGLQKNRQAPPGLAIELTGSATIGRDINVGQMQSASATETWTVVLVIGLLLVIYRAPLLALVPLVTVFCALRISLKLLSFLAEANVITLFEGIQIYITIILYGAGVDYGLFLIARYREELDQGQEARAALAAAIAKVGASITASAATVMFGIGMMAWARFGKFHFAGLAIFFSLFVGLCAVLTLGAPLLCMTGRWAFWPKMPSAQPRPVSIEAACFAKPRLLSWENLAALVVRWPGTVWLASVAMLAPFVVVAVLNAKEVNYDLLQRLPADAPSVAGTKALQKHFSSGATGPVTVLLVNPHVDFYSDDGQALIKKLVERLKRLQGELGLTDILSLATPLGITKAGDITTVDLSLPFPPQAVRIGPGPSLFGGWSLGEGLDLGENYHRQAFVRKKALEHYVSSAGTQKGHATQMQLLLAMNPLSREGADHLSQLERQVWEEMPAELRTDAELYFIGATADIRDLIKVTGADETRIRVLVTGCVFLILLALLRRFVISLYLIASVLFSFFAALGATFAFFWALDPGGFPGLDWKVSVLLFTVLVAIGEDYNIFLMTRIGEEQQGRTQSEEGITRALVKTGGIITSCGIIMAGTFASLLSGSLVDLRQLGFALALGVLLDTFLVRPILVPAFLLVLHRRHISV